MRKKIFWLIPTVIIIVLMFAFVHSLMKRNDNSLLPAGTENIENTTNFFQVKLIPPNNFFTLSRSFPYHYNTLLHFFIGN